MAAIEELCAGFAQRCARYEGPQADRATHVQHSFVLRCGPGGGFAQWAHSLPRPSAYPHVVDRAKLARVPLAPELAGFVLVDSFEPSSAAHLSALLEAVRASLCRPVIYLLCRGPHIDVFM